MDQPLAIILAAGKGKRMNSDLPKVLLPALGRPLVDWVLDAVAAAGVPRAVVVIGHRGELVREALAGRAGVSFAEQREQLGTGHAVRCAEEQFRDHAGPVLVVTGDSPLTQAESLRQLLEEFGRTQPACLLGTLHKADPTGLGRIVRGPDGAFRGIVEEKDATDEQRRITEVNMSIYVFQAAALAESLGQLTNSNRQGEYYLTDCPGWLLARGREVRALPALDPCESLSVNTPAELAIAEAAMRERGYRPAGGGESQSNS